MKCSALVEVLERLAPAEYACDWDNVGLLAGDGECEINTVYLALDATDEVIEEAVRAGADMLITHHPLIFGGIRRVAADDFVGRRIWKLARHNISYYAMHTNFDVCVMADLAAERMGLTDTVVLDETGIRDGKPCGIGRIGAPGKGTAAMTLGNCAALVKERFDIPQVKLFGDLDRDVERIAVSPGSGKSEIAFAVSKGADVLITGDIDHHSGIDAAAQGLCVIDAGHYGLEHIFVDYMAEYLQIGDLGLKVVTREHILPFVIC